MEKTTWQEVIKIPSSGDIRPTRLEYLRAKRRIKIAEKGLKLLKLKRQALILEFFSISKASSRLRSELQLELNKGYQSIRMAEMIDGEMRLENEAMKIPQLKKDIVPLAGGLVTSNVTSKTYKLVPKSQGPGVTVNVASQEHVWTVTVTSSVIKQDGLEELDIVTV